MTNFRRVLLVDNGSLEPASTRQLRRLAAELAARVGERIDPVSLAHSAKVPAEALDGRPAELLDAALERAMGEGVTEVVVLPLFIGPSHAVTRVVPAVLLEKTKAYPDVRAVVAPPLFVPGERRLADILAAQVREQIAGGPCDGRRAGERPRVAIVDHGSPARAVTEVRDAVAAQVRALLGDAVSEVTACSMERRPGAGFEFNEPLIERLLAREAWRTGPVVIGLMFVGPGRHAGPEGDVAQIVARVRGVADMAGGVKFTRAMGGHPLLLEILAARLRVAMARIR